MSDNEVYLPDSRVIPILERMWQRYPTLAMAGTEFVTVRHEPPFSGQMPDGRVGTTDEVIVQFLVVSPHPRRFEYRMRNMEGAMGMLLTTAGTVFEIGWEQAEAEYRNGRYVQVDKRDPLEVIYDGLCQKHVADIVSLNELMN